MGCFGCCNCAIEGTVEKTYFGMGSYFKNLKALWILFLVCSLLTAVIIYIHTQITPVKGDWTKEGMFSTTIGSAITGIK
jgi:hypothetical protein